MHRPLALKTDNNCSPNTSADYRIRGRKCTNKENKIDNAVLVKNSM